MSAFDKLKKFDHLVDAITAAVQEYVDPNTPDERELCKASIERAFEDWAPDSTAGPLLSEYVTATVELVAGGKDAVTHVLQDIDNWFAFHNSHAPDWVHNFAKEFLTDAQAAIAEVRGGKKL